MSESVEQFEDLQIWQQARVLTRNVYRDFSDGSGTRDFGFKDQIQRAAVSIMNNIAEGFERKTDNDFAKFLDYAKGSSGEVRNMYYIAGDQNYVSAQTANDQARQISRGIALQARNATGGILSP